MTQSIIEYYKQHARDPEMMSPEAMQKQGFACCMLPKGYNFRTAYSAAVEFVGSRHFVPHNLQFWFESDALAVQFRLMLP